jgi:hypothetical protein
MNIVRGCYKVLRHPALVAAGTPRDIPLKTLISVRPSATMAHTLVRDQLPKHDYPGLGLPLRHSDWTEYNYYPIGAHGNIWGSDSDMITVRELAMMDIMEKLTDKKDWHVKVFDENIVEKWRTEALAIPDVHFWNLATAAKWQHWATDDAQPEMCDDTDGCELEGIMDESTFDTVRF